MGSKVFRTKLTRVLAVALAATLVPVAAPAFAQTGPGNINPGATGSITVHKLSEPSTPGTAGTSLQSTPDASARQLNGVEFEIKKIDGMDLTSAAGWQKLTEVTALINATDNAKKADAALAEKGHNLSAVGGDNNGKKVTAGDGSVTFANLPVGAYLVTEGDDTGNNGIISKTDPFIVTVPFPTTDGGTNGWNYDVHVYPKNTVSLVEKIVDESAAVKLGDTLRWYVSFTIPGQLDITSFKFSDKIDTMTNFSGLKAAILPADTPKAQFATAFASGEAVQLPNVNKTGLETSGAPSADSVPGSIDVTLNGAAAEKLKQHRNKKLVFEVSVTVERVTGNGQIKNAGSGNEAWAQGEFNQNGKALVPAGEGAPGTSNWGTVDLKTISDLKDKAALNNATFKVYSDAEAAKRAIAGNPQGSDTALAEVTTDTQGQASFSLRNGTYYLAHTGVPAGFQQLAAPIKVDVEGVRTLTHYPNLDNNDGAAKVDNAEWVITLNARTPGDDATSLLPNLPITGGFGQLLLALAGTTVLAVAVVTFVAASRRRKQH
ncbi:hypothetical protein EII31_03690 [Leucobacter sp. OH2974_COT-288]|nr:hypothetical protein EII31_03690 [Leucobacter sp. OH2974_COT-288]